MSDHALLEELKQERMQSNVANRAMLNAVSVAKEKEEENGRLRAELEQWKAGTTPEMMELYAEAQSIPQARIDAALAKIISLKMLLSPGSSGWECANNALGALRGEKP